MKKRSDQAEGQRQNAQDGKAASGMPGAQPDAAHRVDGRTQDHGKQRTHINQQKNIAGKINKCQQQENANGEQNLGMRLAVCFR